MTMQAITLTLDQAQMMVALSAQSTNELLEVVEITKKEYQQNVMKARETITSQAERIKELEAALTNEKAARQQEGSALRGALAAERAKYIAAAKVDAGRIAELGRRVDQESASIKNHRAVIANLIDHFESPGDANWQRARAILN